MTGQQLNFPELGREQSRFNFHDDFAIRKDEIRNVPLVTDGKGFGLVQERDFPKGQPIGKIGFTFGTKAVCRHAEPVDCIVFHGIFDAPKLQRSIHPTRAHS